MSAVFTTKLLSVRRQHTAKQRLGIQNLHGALGEHVHTHLIGLKRAEWDEYRTQVSPWEIERYLPVM